MIRVYTVEHKYRSEQDRPLDRITD